MATAPDGSGRVFISEQPGRITVINAHNPEQAGTLALDITDRVNYQLEQGLFTIAFHPDFANNGWVFLLYSAGLGYGDVVLSRFTAPDPTADAFDPDSELQLIVLPQPHFTHNGGGLTFGNDGYLYVGFGDGKSTNPPDSFDRGQTLDNLYAKVLRIDVANSTAEQPYAIPESNPYLFPDSDKNEVIIESRSSSGQKTEWTDGYVEAGSFTDSDLKSAAPGLTGKGSRLSNGSPNPNAVYYYPDLDEGMYTIYVTVPDSPDANATDVEYTIATSHESLGYVVPLTAESAGDKWLRLRRNVYMTGSGDDWVRLQSSGEDQHIFADAIKFERAIDIRPEIYAIGIRNPWRLSTNSETGDILIGDVGEITREEVNILEPRGNFGWPEMEGSVCQPQTYRDGNFDITGYINPAFEYDHALGCSITGGFIYRGNDFPEIYGYYIFADFCGGVFAVDLYNDPHQDKVITLASSRELKGSPGLCEGPDGEILITVYATHSVYTLTSLDGSSWLFH